MIKELRVLLATAITGSLIFGARSLAFGDQGFSLTPMYLREPRGVLQLTNANTWGMHFRLTAFPPRYVEGSMTADLIPYSQEEQDILLRIRPQAARLAPKSTRNFSYKILAPARTFYVCATTPDGNLLLRICSRWQGSS